VLVKGETAIDALKNNNNFKRVGVALRNAPISLETKDRAASRVMELTGEAVMPLEQDISQAVTRHFPGFLNDYAPLATRLESLRLPGIEPSKALQDGLKDILRADASDATPILGAEKCELHTSLLWARNVVAALDNGLDITIRSLRGHIEEIASLPDDGAAGDLKISTEILRSEVCEILATEDFYARQTDLKRTLTDLQAAVRVTCAAFVEELNSRLDAGILAIQSMSEWLRIGAEEQAAFSDQLAGLRVVAGDDLTALKSLLGLAYRIAVGLERIRAEVLAHGTPSTPPYEPDEPDDKPKPPKDVTVSLPETLTAVDQVDVLIAQFQDIRSSVAKGVPVRIHFE